MAHPCWSCGGECYCHGDIDDTITSHTPANCKGCGSGVVKAKRTIAKLSQAEN